MKSTMPTAVVLAGGKGTRLRPYTATIPKPLVPVGDKAILEILLVRLKKYGTERVIICVNHLAQLIMAFFGDGKKIGLKIEYAFEDRPLGTVAPIKSIRNLPDNFLVLNGDLVTDININKFYKYHINGNAPLTVATYTRIVNIDFGVISIDPLQRRAIGFQEKPNYLFNVSMGIYGFNKNILDLVPSNAHFGFDDLVTKMLKRKIPIGVFQYKGFWLDIGRPEDYDKINMKIPRFCKI